jgi:DNA-binding beta-propeller fold protein YncE
MTRLAFIFVAILALLPSLRAAVEVLAGQPTTEALSEPFSIDFDTQGTLYGVEFTKSNRVYRLDKSGLKFIAGVHYNAEKEKKKPEGDMHDGSDPLQAMFNGMHDLRVMRDGRIVIADSFNNRLRLFDPKSGAVSTLAGTGKTGFAGDGGPPASANFSTAMTASLSPDGGHIYIADVGNHRVRMIDLAANRISTVAGSGSKGQPVDGADALQTSMGDARAVTQAPDGTLYVLLRGGNSLVAVKDGKARTVVNAAGKKGYSGDGGPGRDAMMNGPKYVAMDPAGNVLICDTENHCVRRYSPQTQKIELIAGRPPKAGTQLGATFLETELRRPHGLRFGPGGLLYIADTYNNRVLRGEYR